MTRAWCFNGVLKNAKISLARADLGTWCLMLDLIIHWVVLAWSWHIRTTLLGANGSVGSEFH